MTDLSRLDLGKAMALLIVYLNGESEIVLLDSIANSEKIVKTIEPGETLWSGLKAEESYRLNGIRFKNVKLAMFIRAVDQHHQGGWSLVSKEECVKTWVDYTGNPVVTHYFVFRIEHKKDNEIIVYCFSPPQHAHYK